MVSALPVGALQPYCQAGLLKVLIPNLNVQIGVFGIITHRHRQLSPGAQVLLAAIRAAAADMYPRRSPAAHREVAAGATDIPRSALAELPGSS
jgi:hypothetical protein